MKTIRINELARELEVKPKVIIDLLPDYGVSEKKTHSSSIDEDVAIKIKNRLGYDGELPASMTSGDDSGPADMPRETASDDFTEVAAPMPPEIEFATRSVNPETESLIPSTLQAGPVSNSGVNTPTAPEPIVRGEGPRAPLPSDETRPSSAAPVRPAGAGPLRPPLGGGRPLVPPVPNRAATSGGATAVATPPAPPARPPVTPAVNAAPPATAAATTTPPPAPATPPTRPVSGPSTPLPTSTVLPPRPAPPTPRPAGPGAPQARTTPLAPEAGRPGQILSGPRAPLPSGGGEGARPNAAPGVPRPPVTPGPAIPRPPMGNRPGGPLAPRPPQQAGGGPGGPSQPSPSRPPLAAQPPTRPVVPPRPDLAEKLRQQNRSAAPPPAPGLPRPAAPQQSRPIPGKPLYSGSPRPGTPTPGRSGPGMPGPMGRGGPGGGPGGRMRTGMHPTSPLRPESAVPAPTDQRRGQRKPQQQVFDRDAALEREERNLRLPQHRRHEAAPPPPIDREITISEGITVKELADKLNVKANLVIKKLLELKIFATINQTLDVKTAEKLAREFGASTNQVSYEEEKEEALILAEESTAQINRAPVITIMGHVDHGKTSLLDAIRETNVAAREAGGITQHIGAYVVEKNNRKIVFIDTPGHEAFTRMRARGAKVTDIVILVVSADDGVMPQTLEAIDHARAAKVPIIVAINKIDKGDANPDRIKQQLADRGLLPEEYGGDTIMVPVSARTKQNLDLLLEMILLVSDLQDLKANPNRPATGTVLEAKLDKGRGPVATVLVRAGTLRIGDFFICGQVFGKVRAMYNDRGEQVREAEPSIPIEVLGLDALPEVGDTFQVVTDTAKAKQIVMYRESKAREQAMARNKRITLEQLSAQMKEGETKELLVVLKADVGGTAEVLSDMLQKLSTDKVKIRVLSAGVGAITESDVLLASASNAIIVGFNVRPERNASATAEQEKVDIRLHTIIYDLIDEMKKAMAGMLEPVYKEVYRGRAQVREVFRVSKVGTVAGCMVVDGLIGRKDEVRVLRDNVVVHTGKIDSLKRFKDDASEVKQGFECGIGVANFNDIKQGDLIEAFVTERVAQEALI